MGILTSALALLVSSTIPLQVPLGLWRSDSHQVISKDFDNFVEGVRTNAAIPGISIGVVHPNGNVEYGSWGQRTEDGDAMTPETLFIIASCSKAFTATAVGVLIDDFAQGKNSTALPPGVNTLDWSTKIADLLPGEWELMDKWASSKANLKDILSHVSGMPRHDFAYGFSDSAADVVHRMRYLRPAFELRQKWSYNNQMFMLATHIVSTYSGMPFTEFVKARIFEPANMTSSTYSVAEASANDQLTESWAAFGRRLPIWFDLDKTGINAGPGGVITNVVDMVNWLKVLLNSGVHPVSNTTVLSGDAFSMITSAHAIESGVPQIPKLSISGYGFGWSRVSYKGHEAIHHSGAIPGFSTMTAFLPSDGIGLVVLINSDEQGDRAQAIMMKAVDELLKLKSEPNTHGVDVTPASSKKNASSAAMAKTPLSLDVEKYAGTYTDPGYGNITLCSTTSSSQHCQKVLSELSPFEDYSHNASSPVRLYASFNAIWCSHIRLIHQAGDTFAVTMTSLFPHGYGKNSTPFETWDKEETGPEAKFLVEDGEILGFGLVGTVGEMTERERAGGSIKDTADAWFNKV